MTHNAADTCGVFCFSILDRMDKMDRMNLSVAWCQCHTVHFVHSVILSLFQSAIGHQQRQQREQDRFLAHEI